VAWLQWLETTSQNNSHTQICGQNDLEKLQKFQVYEIFKVKKIRVRYNNLKIHARVPGKVTISPDSI